MKSQIGHPQGASGAAGLAATMLGMRCGFLPPTINLETPDPECDLDYVPNAARPAQVEFALVQRDRLRLEELRARPPERPVSLRPRR